MNKKPTVGINAMVNWSCLLTSIHVPQKVASQSSIFSCFLPSFFFFLDSAWGLGFVSLPQGLEMVTVFWQSALWRARFRLPVLVFKAVLRSHSPQAWNWYLHSAPNCFFQLQGILHLWVFMVCLHSAPVRVPSRVPSPQSPLLGTHTLHCHSPQSDFFTFFSGFSFFPASAVSTAAKMKMNARTAAANFWRCCRYCWDCIFELQTCGGRAAAFVARGEVSARGPGGRWLLAPRRLLPSCGPGTRGAPASPLSPLGLPLLGACPGGIFGLRGGEAAPAGDSLTPSRANASLFYLWKQLIRYV